MKNPELVIWVDDEDHELGRLGRDVVHDKSHLLLHREAMVILFANPEHTDFWLQQRSPNKKQYPNFWTLGVTCHVNSDDINATDPEGYLNAARREGPEELGISIANPEIVKKEIIETTVNRALAAIIVAECFSTPIPDGDEVVRVERFNKETLEDIRDKLTPGALHCLKIIGLIGEEHE